MGVGVITNQLELARARRVSIPSRPARADRVLTRPSRLKHVEQHARRAPAHRPRLGGVFRGRHRVHGPSDRQALANLRATAATGAATDTAVGHTELEPRTSRPQAVRLLTHLSRASDRLIMGRALGPQVGLTVVQFTAVRQLRELLDSTLGPKVSG
jgi:hypothetical protein